MTDQPEAENGKYVSSSQQCLLAVIEALSITPLRETSATELADLLPRISRDQAHRALANLAAAEWAERGPAGGWRLAPKVTQISDRYRRAITDHLALHLGDL